MKSTLTAIALALAGTAVLAPAPVAAQEAPARQLEVSKKARPALAALQEAVNAKNWAAVPGLATAARAAAEKADDRYYLGNLLVRAGQEQENIDMMAEGIETMQTSGYPNDNDFVAQYINVGKLYYNAENFAPAIEWFNKAAKLDPTNAETQVLIGEVYNRQEKYAEALGAMARGIELQRASGQPVNQDWYKRAVSVGYTNQLLGVAPIGLMWVQDNPTTETWRNSLRVLEAVLVDTNTLKDAELVDLWRLMRATDSLESEREYVFYADELAATGYPGEALAVINQGIERGVIDANKVTFKEFLTTVRSSAKGDKEDVVGGVASALAAKEARPAIATGNALYGYDMYAEAADAYRAALTKSGADTSLVNLRLGMALARAGQKDEANAAFALVDGKYKTLATYWAAWNDYTN